MKTKLLILTIIAAITGINAKAQSNFDKDIAPWHKKAILTCGMLKNTETLDATKLSANLNELKAEWTSVVKQYGQTPPKEYANDPVWNIYLLKLTDIIDIISNHTANKDYKKAVMYCPQICMTIGKMHKISGLTDLTDVMFSWKMEIKTTMDMVNAGNIKGAGEDLPKVAAIYSKVNMMKQIRNNENLDLMFKELDNLYNRWLANMNKKDFKSASVDWSNFSSMFSKVYISTL